LPAEICSTSDPDPPDSLVLAAAPLNGISAGAASDDQTTAKGRGFELVVASSDANDDGVASGL
jgi:hypothetical protein